MIRQLTLVALDAGRGIRENSQETASLQASTPGWEDSMDMVASAEPSQILIDHRALERRARRYSSRCVQWLDRSSSHERPAADERDHPVAIVDRLSDLVATEIVRALAESSDTGPERHIAQADAYASATIALIAIEQSRQAWLSLVREQQVLATAAQPFVSDLVWLKHEVERAFPGIRIATIHGTGKV